MGILILFLVSLGLPQLVLGVEEGETDSTIVGVVMLIIAITIPIPWKLIPALNARALEEQRRREEEEGRRKEEERRARLELQRKEIMALAHATEDIIQKVVDDATNTEDSLWLSAILIIQQDFRSFTREFEGGTLSYADAKALFMDLKEQAQVLGTPPPKEEISGEPGEEPTYYDILEISPDATQGEIKKAYWDKIKDYHPDRFMNQPEWVQREAEEMSKRLNDAYEVLGDVDERKKYDRKIGKES